MTDLSKIKARIKALREMTTGQGCTEAEALAAAEKAAELLSRHGLTEADLEMDSVEADVDGRRTPMDGIYPMVAHFAHCRCWQEGKGAKRVIVYFGRAGDVLVAGYVHDVIRRVAREAIAAYRRSDTYKRRRTAKTRAQLVKSYVEGLAAGIRRQLSEGLWRRLANEAPLDQLAGYLANHMVPVDAALQGRGLKLVVQPPIARSSSRHKTDTRLKGYGAGVKAPIHGPVAATPAAPAALPPPGHG